VTIDRNKDVYLNAKPVRSGSWRPVVKEVLEDKSDKISSSMLDEEAPYSAVMDTMDELRHAASRTWA
jgi:biopolymer transport protein ExbD